MAIQADRPGAPVPGSLPPAVTRDVRQVEAVHAQSLLEMGEAGRVALAWEWVLTGEAQSPVTLMHPDGRPPAREEVLAEAGADPVGSTAPPGVPTDFCDQLGEARRVLRWLTGDSDEIPVDTDNRGRFIGARGDYAHTDAEIREIRERARHGLAEFDLPGTMDPRDARRPWQWDPAWMNAAWLRGVRDLLDWVLGDRGTSPLSGQTEWQPALALLDLEEDVVGEVAQQGRPGGIPVDPGLYPPPQYGEAIQATIQWLRGESANLRAGRRGLSVYTAGPD